MAAITTTVYDADDNVIATIDPLDHTTSYAYDALNREVTMTRRPRRHHDLHLRRRRQRDRI